MRKKIVRYKGIIPVMGEGDLRDITFRINHSYEKFHKMVEYRAKLGGIIRVTAKRDLDNGKVSFIALYELPSAILVLTRSTVSGPTGFLDFCRFVEETFRAFIIGEPKFKEELISGKV